ncbi:MAG: hypothetical protein WCW56_03295 [Candidatus Paceibacterota bacterium]|jgi:hypothetical protein
MENEIVLKAQMLPVWRTTKNAFRYYQKRFKLISGIVALPITFYLVATILHSFSATYFWGGPLFFLGFVAAIFSTLAIYQAMIEGAEQEIWACYKKGTKKLFSFLWLAILMAVIILGGIILGVIPGIILSVWLAMSAIILFAEDEKGLRALIKSRNYVRDYWWPIFGRSLFLSLLMVAVSFITMAIFGLMSSENPADFSRNIASEWANFFRLIIVFIFVLPFQISFIYSLYLQLKKIKADDSSVEVMSRRTKNWFVGLGIFGVVAPLVMIMLVATFAMGGVFGFLLQDVNVNGPVKAWLYNRGLIENNNTLIDKTDTMLRDDEAVSAQ